MSDDRLSPTEAAGWRAAARQPGLHAVTASGERVDPAEATRDHVIRGSLADREVHLAYARGSRLTTARVEILRPLLLGIEAHAWVPPVAPDGRSLGGFRTAQRGIDQARVNAFLGATDEGRALAVAMKELGLRGWVEVADDHVQAELELVARDETLYVDLLRRMVRLASAAEAARAALAPEPWEESLAAGLEAAAASLRLRFERARFEVSGDVGGARVELRLEAKDRYSLFARAALPTKLDPGVVVEPRRGLASKLPLLLGARGSTRQRRFNWLFEASPAVDGALDDAALDGLVELMTRGAAVALDPSAVRYRTTRLDADPAHVVGRLVDVRDRIARAPRSSPYR